MTYFEDEPFYGQELSYQECEVVMLQQDFPAKLYQGESDLFQTKWWDYRSLHPVKATYLFAHHYRKSYRYMTQRRDDVDKGQYVRGFKGDDVFELSTRERNGFWKARRTADALGVPYDFYMIEGMRYADHTLWKRLPRPTQVYSEPFIEQICERWQEINNAMTVMPSSRRFLLSDYVGAEDQREFREWLCRLIERSRVPQAMVYQHVFETPRISEEAAIDRFGSELVERARYF